MGQMEHVAEGDGGVNEAGCRAEALPDMVEKDMETMAPSQSRKSIVVRIGRVSFDRGTARLREDSAPVLAPVIVHILENLSGHNHPSVFVDEPGTEFQRAYISKTASERNDI